MQLTRNLKLSSLKHALYYASIGWSVLPIKPRGKAPLTLHGVKEATRDSQQIDAWWVKWPGANVGIAMGEPSGVVALDVDPRHGGDGTLESLIAEHGPLPDTVMALTGGGGQHYLFKWHDGLASKKIGPGVDLISTGKYIVVAPSIHPDTGAEYVWEASSTMDDVKIAELPEWLRAFVGRSDDAAEGTVDCIAPHQIAEIRSALAAIPSYDDRDVWNKIGMAIHSASNGQRGYDLWTDWSKQSEKFDSTDQMRVWRSFKSGNGITLATLFGMAKENGWAGAETRVEEVQEPLRALRTNKAMEPMPEELCRIPGKLQVMVDWIMATSYRPNPFYAVIGALAFGALTCGRRYWSGPPARPSFSNLFFVCLGGTSFGKEDPIINIVRAMEDCGAHEWCNQGRYSSPMALHTALIKTPNLLWVQSEIGLLISEMQGSGGKLQREVMSELMEVFSKADGSIKTMQLSGLRRDAKQYQIFQPHVSIFGTSTPETFFDAFTGKSVRSGLLPRFLVYNAPSRVNKEEEPVGRPETPPEIVKWFRDMRGIGEGNLSEFLPSEVSDRRQTMQEILITPEARPILKAWSNRIEDLMERDDLYTRTYQKGLRVANIMALSKSEPGKPMLDTECAQMGCSLAYELDRRMVAQVADSISDTEHSRTLKRALSQIRAECEVTREPVTKTWITLKTCLGDVPGRIRNDAMAQLLDTGQLQGVKQSTKGAPVSLFWPTDDYSGISKRMAKRLNVTVALVKQR